MKRTKDEVVAEVAELERLVKEVAAGGEVLCKGPVRARKAGNQSVRGLMYHFVFCRAAAIPTGQDVANWALDAAAFDEEPRFDPPFEQLDREVSAFELIYDEGKRPIQIERLEGEQLKAIVQDAIVDIEASCEEAVILELKARLHQSAQGFSIEIDEVGATDDTWELIYDLDARIARHLDGVIYVPNEAVYDGADNEPICTLDE